MKKCPRCGRKLGAFVPKCDTCGLIFDRLSLATNSAGKKAIKEHHENKVLYIKNPPSDISKWKLFFISLFFGFLGVQFYKVGRNKWFYFMLFAFFTFIIFASLEFFGIGVDNLNMYLRLILYFRYLPGALGFLIWIASTLQIAFNLFKYPVSIDESFVLESIDATVAKDILDKAQINRTKTQKSGKKVQKICTSCGKQVRVDVSSSICPKCKKMLDNEVKYGDE